jgi:DHA2 family multidrug resistance protein
MGYTALQSGIAVSPRGAGALVTMPIVGYLTAKVDFRKLIGLGFFLVAVSLLIISNLSLETPVANIAWPSVLTGVGLSMLFVPLTTVSMGTLPQKDIGNASGVFNLMRNVGGSFGVSLLTTYLARHSQANQVTLVSNLSPLNMPYQQRLAEIQNFFAGRIAPSEALRHAQGYLYNSLLKQAQLLSFVQSFRMLAILSLVCIVLAFFLKRVRRRKPIAAH